MITPDVVRAIQSLWPSPEAGGAPATKLDLARLRGATTDVFNRLNVTTRPVAGTWGPG